MNDLIYKIVKEISENHHKIIDDWCKAYMAELYERGFEIKPGNFILNEQELHERDGKMIKRYWFSLRDEPYHFDKEF